MNGGKFCEVTYSILQGAVAGAFPKSATKPKNMLDSCRALENIAADAGRVGDRSLRVLIPRLLPALYEIRNNRGVGHVGGDVDPNHEDAEAVVAISSWILAELVRIFHGVDLDVAQTAVDQIVERKHPLIWKIGGKKRVLDPSLSVREQTMLLLYSEPEWISIKSLIDWVEYSNASQFRNRVIGQLHKERMLEFDASVGTARISPKGMRFVESELL